MEWMTAIERAVEFGRRGQIDNLKVLIKRQKEEEDPDISLQYVYDIDPSKSYLTTPNLLANPDGEQTLLHQLFQARNLFYHPAHGIIGVKVYLYIRRTRLPIISLLSSTLPRNKRLHL